MFRGSINRFLFKKEKECGWNNQIDFAYIIAYKSIFISYEGGYYVSKRSNE
jgi:hypothetical protein